MEQSGRQPPPNQPDLRPRQEVRHYLEGPGGFPIGKGRPQAGVDFPGARLPEKPDNGPAVPHVTGKDGVEGAPALLKVPERPNQPLGRLRGEQPGPEAETVGKTFVTGNERLIQKADRPTFARSQYPGR